MKSYYTYILQCSDGSYYTGVTNDIKKRFYEYQEGLIEGCYTHNKRPVKLMHVEEFTDIVEAINREKQIKGWRACCTNSKMLLNVMLNLFQHLIKSICYETLKRVQGDKLTFVQQALDKTEKEGFNCWRL